jgi:hypothetical protein
MPNVFIWFQIQPKLFAVCLKICLFGRTIRKVGECGGIFVSR